MGRILRRALVFGAVGLLVGFGLHLFVNRPIRWRRLPPTASPALALIDICQGTVYVRTEDGLLAREWGRGAEVWALVSAPEKCVRGTYDTYGACDLSTTPFSADSHPPKDARSCLQSWTSYVEGYLSEAYILDGDGRVWRWLDQYYNGIAGEAYYDQFLPFVCCPALGIFVGLLTTLQKRRKLGPQGPSVGTP